MKVSQYMYTACGKLKKGDFCVWAKSPDITDAEGEEIHQMMNYKKPSGVNLYEATEEEIRAACPTKYAYFILSTGKKVLAESNFIGRVYSVQDTRWGNFFIHAYVFDSLGDVTPMSVLAKGLFKSKLEYKEWHDDPCPETLPQLELNPVSTINIQAVEAFLTPERKQRLLPLLQSAIKAANGGEAVSFNDTEENQKMWYTVLGMLLPAPVRENATFGSQVVPLFTAAAPVPGRQSAKPLTIRNIADGTPTSVFNYSMSASMKQPVFDFRNNIYGEIELDKYITELGSALQKSLISALEYVKDIENLCKAYSCSTEQALSLYMLKNGKISFFASLESYVATLDYAEKCGMISAQSNADLVYRAVFVNRQWTPQPIALPLLGKIYSYGNQVVKDEMIGYYLQNCGGYGATSVSNPAAYVEEFFRSAPFGKRELLVYLYNKNLCASGFTRSNAFVTNYLVYDTFLNGYNREEVATRYPVLSEILACSVSKKAYAEIDLLVQRIYAASPELTEGLLRDIIDAYLDPVRDSDTLFHLIDILKIFELQLDILKKIITANSGSSSFIPTYISYFNKNSAVYTQLESVLARDRAYESILIARETYSFRQNANVSRNELNAYFNKYYLTGRDDGLYFDKLKSYLKSNPGVKACAELYSDIGSTDISYRDMAQIYAYLEAVMYLPAVDEIINYPRQYAEVLDRLDNKLISIGAETSAKRNVVNLARALLAADKDKNVAAKIRESAYDGNLYAGIDERQLDSIVSGYLTEILEVYAEYREYQNKSLTEQDELNNIIILSGLICPLIARQSFITEFSKSVGKLKSRQSALLFTDMFVYASCCEDSGAQAVNRMLVRYIEAIGRKAGRVYDDVLENVRDARKQQVEDFINKNGGSKKVSKRAEPEPEAPKKVSKKVETEDEGQSEGEAPKKGFFATAFGGLFGGKKNKK